MGLWCMLNARAEKLIVRGVYCIFLHQISMQYIRTMCDDKLSTSREPRTSRCVGKRSVPYDGRKVTTCTTHQWYVVLEECCVVYVGKPPTLHNNGMSCWRYVVLCMSVNLQHCITMVCRVGGILCCVCR